MQDRKLEWTGLTGLDQTKFNNESKASVLRINPVNPVNPVYWSFNP
jgi:hypothetical protein